MASIDEIKEITKTNADKRREKNEKIIEARRLQEDKYAKKCIDKMNKLIMKEAKKGEDYLYYTANVHLTDTQCWTIMRYFEKEGYTIKINRFYCSPQAFTLRW